MGTSRAIQLGFHDCLKYKEGATDGAVDGCDGCLPSDTSKTYAGQKATVSGWGTLSSGGNQPTVLMEVDVTVTTNTFCSGVYGSGISDINICAMDAGKDSCQGDSGGPLFIQENGRYS